MLERVETILQTWERDGVEAALSLNLPLPAPQELEGSLSTLSPEDRRHLMARLDDFAAAIIVYQEHAATEMQGIKEDLQRMQSAVNACQSYTTRNKDA